MVIPNSHPWNQPHHVRQVARTYGEIDTTKFISLLPFEGKSINGHQANDEKEGTDEHFRGVVGMCKECVVKSGGISRSTTFKKWVVRR